jgi:hypothetical protein
MSDSNEEPGIDSNIRRILSGISALELNVTNITVELTRLSLLAGWNPLSD